MPTVIQCSRELLVLCTCISFTPLPLQVDRFWVSAVDLSKLTKVVISHDGKGLGSGWYLDKVVIEEPATTGKRYTFNCDR